MNAEKNLKSLLKTLISFASISNANNQSFITWLSDYAQPFVDKIIRVPHLPAEKDSLLLQIGTGAGGLVLSGHLDVVPVAGQHWTGDPFVLREQEGKYFGRGVADMKGFIACALALLPQIKTVQQPLYLALTCDEEIGCLGAPAMVDALIAQGAKNPYVWVGEPTSLSPVVGQKGITNFRTTFRGRAAHSSQIHQGTSAILAASEFILAAERIMHELASTHQNPDFDVPFTSIHVGKIAGGEAINIVPEKCVMEWEIRHLPAMQPADLLNYFADLSERLKQDFAGLEIETEATIATVAALEDKNNSAWFRLLSQHLPTAKKEYVAYATEAGIFQQAGFESIICGPGSIRQAHQADEWIEIEQLTSCYQIMRAVIQERCGAVFYS